MNCQKCNSERIVRTSAKCSDCFSADMGTKEHIGYVPRDIGIGGGDYVNFTYCLECGQIQGQFPMPDPEFVAEHHTCSTCGITDEDVKQQYDNGLAAGTHHDECFRQMVAECRQRSW